MATLTLESLKNYADEHSKELFDPCSCWSCLAARKTGMHMVNHLAFMGSDLRVHPLFAAFTDALSAPPRPVDQYTGAELAEAIQSIIDGEGPAEAAYTLRQSRTMPREREHCDVCSVAVG